jgi:hypothetical protein
MDEQGLTLECLHLDALPATWDDWVRQSPQGTPFALRGWLASVAEVLSLDVDVWIVSAQGQWLAALPLLARRRLGIRINPEFPLAFYRSPLYAGSLCQSTYPSSVTHEYLRLTRRLAQGLAPAYGSVSLSLPQSLLDVRPWLWEGWTASPAFTYILDLDRDLRFAKDVKHRFRKGNEAGYRFATAWDLDAHCHLLRSTLRRQGVGTGLGEGPYRRLSERLQGAGLAWMATAFSREGEPLATCMELGLDQGLYHWTAGTLAGKLSAGGSQWLMVRMVEEARARGYLRWDLCGASYENVAKYKSDYGGRLEPSFTLSAPRCWTEWGLQDGRRLASRLLRSLGWRRR